MNTPQPLLRARRWIMESQTKTAWVVAVFAALAALGVVAWNDDRNDDRIRESDRRRELANLEAQAAYNRYLILLFEHQDCIRTVGQHNDDRTLFTALYDTFDRFATSPASRAVIDELRDQLDVVAPPGRVLDCPPRPVTPDVELDGFEE